MDVDAPRGAKRKADALDDTAVPRRIRVGWQVFKLKVITYIGLLNPSCPRLWTKMSSTKSPRERLLWRRSTP